MSKKMIGADAFEKLVDWLDKKYEYCKDIHGIETRVVSFKFLLEKIKELATPAPEPQESISDADGWCMDLKAIPKNTLIDLAVQCVKDKSINREVNYLLNDNNDFYNSDYEHYLDDTYEFGYVITAWRPLPTLPKDNL